MFLNRVQIINNLDNHFKIKNVCAYARVSTDKDTQETSFEMQVSHYTNLIFENPEWNFVGVYADEGISGTSTKKREQFNVMIDLAKLGKIDLILTKSISRFSRNIVDALSILQELKRYGVEVFFEKENISSFDSKIEFVISVLSGMAQEESRSNSENVKWSVRNNFKKGEYYFNTNNLLGYKRDAAGNIYIDEKEAELVRLIYNMYLSGTGTTSIAKFLTQEGYKTITGLSKWNTSSVLGILKNEKYAGSALLQKTVRLTYLERKSSDNNNYLPKYYIDESHEGIISKEMFKQVQDKFNDVSPLRKKAYEKMRNTNRYTKYAGLIYCGHCGKPYRHKINNGTSKYAKSILVCTSNETKKCCEGESIFTDTMNLIINNQIKHLIERKDKALNIALQAFKNDTAISSLKTEIERTKQKISETKTRLDALALSNCDIDKAASIKLKSTLKELTITYAGLNNELTIKYNLDLMISKFKKTLEYLKSLNGDYSSFPLKELFSKVIIKSRNEIVFYLNFRSFDDIIKQKQIPSFVLTTEHLIRKTTIKTVHGIVL